MKHDGGMVLGDGSRQKIDDAGGTVLTPSGELSLDSAGAAPDLSVQRKVGEAVVALSGDLGIFSGAAGGVEHLEIDGCTRREKTLAPETVQLDLHRRMADPSQRTGVGEVQAAGDQRRASARTCGSARSGLPQINGLSNASARRRRSAT